MTPYEVFFFSSGAVEEKWTAKDLAPVAANVLVGFPLGGMLSSPSPRAPRSCCCPQAIEVDVAVADRAAGRAGRRASSALAFVIVGIVAATFGAALETTLSSGYTLAQFFGWSLGQVPPPGAGRAVPRRDDRLPPGRPAAC